MRKPIAGTGGKPMATGSKRIIPMSGPRPGMAPTIRPMMIPANVRPRASGDRKTSSPADRNSKIMAHLPGDKDVPDAERKNDIQENFENERKARSNGNG